MPNGEPLPLYQKAGAGLAAGGLGALVGSPADLSLIRMQADSTLPVDQRRNYKGVGDALTRIVREEGAGGLFRGAGPTVVRAMALNMGMLASNDQAKEMLEAAGYGGQTAVMGGRNEKGGRGENRKGGFFSFLFFLFSFKVEFRPWSEVTAERRRKTVLPLEASERASAQARVSERRSRLFLLYLRSERAGRARKRE